MANPLPPIASIWHRAGALIVDVALLGVIGHIIGWLLWSTWFQMGPYGRLVGVPVILLYFGVFNARQGRGQTPGKRLANIAVRDAAGGPVGLGCSFLRITVLVIPFILSGWDLPVFDVAVWRWLQLAVVLGLGAAILYPVIFDQVTHQGLHDRICQTYVVLLGARPVKAYPQPAPRHRKVMLALILAGMIGAGLLVGLRPYLFGVEPPFVQALQEKLAAEDHLFDIDVSDRLVTFLGPQPVRFLDIQAQHRGYLASETERVEALDQIAAIALTEVERIDEFDILSVSLTVAYDIGIAQRSFTFNENLPLEAWRARLTP